MSEAVEHNPSAASHGTVLFCGYEPLNTLLNTALNATGFYSALPRAILNGEEPYVSLFRQLDTNAAQVVQHHISVTIQPRRQRGRPPGSGTYATAEDLLHAIRPIIQGLRQQGTYPSQKKVADRLSIRTTERQLRAWLYDFKISWNDLLNSR